MPVQFRWWDDTTFYYNISGEWSCLEVLEAARAGNHSIASVNHPVTVLVDMTAISGFPDGFMAYLRPETFERTSNTARVYVFLPDNSLTRMFMSVHRRMYGILPTTIVIVLNQTPEQVYASLQRELIPSL
jgi:hypothetical protein